MVPEAAAPAKTAWRAGGESVCATSRPLACVRVAVRAAFVRGHGGGFSLVFSVPMGVPPSPPRTAPFASAGHGGVALGATADAACVSPPSRRAPRARPPAGCCV